MELRNLRFISTGVFGFALLVVPSFAQVPDQADAGDRQTLQATVVDCHGNVKRAPAGVGPVDQGWVPVQLGELLPAGTQIKTGLRSSVALEFGDDTIVQIRKVSLASIDDYHQTATTKTVALGLGYGTVRGGSLEADLRTDVVVDSTVATLAKRGTEGWQIDVEPITKRFWIGTHTGEIDAFMKAIQRRRSIRSQEYVNNRNVRDLWVNQSVRDRKVSFYDGASVADSETQFAADNSGGATVVSPDASQGSELTKRIDPTFVTQQLAARDTVQQDSPSIFLPPSSQLRLRPEGDFGNPPTFSNLLTNVLPPNAKAGPSHLTRRFERPAFRPETPRVQPRSFRR